MKRPVLFVNACTSVWGAEESMLELAEELDSLGYEPRLMTCSDELELAWRSRISGNPVYRVRTTQRETSVGRLLRTVSFGIRIASVPTQRVVIFSHYLLPVAAIVRARGIFSRQAPPRVVFDVHDNLSTPRAAFVTRVFVRFVDEIIVVSQFTAGHLPPHRPRTRVIHSSIEATKPARRNAAGDAFVCGLVGRIDPEKKHHLVIQAIADLPNVYLDIRGSAAVAGQSYADAVASAALAILGNRVRLSGRVPRDQVLDGLDVLIVANAEEPMGRTVGEAQLAGIPVITPDAGGSAELVEHEVTGLTYPAGDAIGLRKAIERLRLDPTLRTELTSRAKVAADARHDLSKYARDYAAAFGD